MEKAETTGGVGDVHPVAEQLGDETGIAGLGAAGAGAVRELQEGLPCWMNWLPLTAGVVLHVGLGSDLGHASKSNTSCCAASSSWPTMVRAPTGQTPTHRRSPCSPEEKQPWCTSVNTDDLALASLHVHDLGRSNGREPWRLIPQVRVKGRMVAWGQTYAQLLHRCTWKRPK